jgi:hypothetical protein
MSRLIAALLLAACAAPAGAQRVVTYSQSQTGPDFLTYGLPVPLPIDSLTPVDGFRSYASLEARLQSLALESGDLSAHDVGRTTAGRTVWAYVVGDADGVDVEGRPEAAFFINANTHAREWAAPEVSTGTVERLVGRATDGGITRYLLDNTRLVIIPVQNIDGLLQTQRFPTQAIVGQDPEFASWPRDGRMRRKNMRGADENLLTFGDHLNGIDLNRNHPPFWATTVGQGGSSANPNSLTFHGAGPHSEAENQALRAAAQLGPATRFRLGIDVHSFSRVFFSSNTARERLNAIQANLIYRMREHHFVVANRFYNDVPDPPNRGIGTAAEYFAYEWLVPAWTLELEPRDSPVEYGGLNVNHGGFILPASEARRVREGWAESHVVGFYMMAGPPHLKRVRLYDAQSNALVLETRWDYDPVSGRRQRVTPVPGTLVRGARYRAELGFSKPMRFRNANGNIAALPGSAADVPLDTFVSLLRGTTSTPLDTSGGSWLTDPARVLRYKDDTFAFEFLAPADAGDVTLRADVNDMVGLRLDADPSTPADWSAGAWSEWEDSTGADTDFGGFDATTALRVADALPVEFVASSASGTVVGEGDTLTLRLRRPVAGPERITLLRFETNGDLPGPETVASWESGVSGERSVEIAVPDDLVAQGDASLLVQLGVVVDGAQVGTLQLGYTRLDNDAADLGVLRVREPGSLGSRWEQLRQGPVARQAVLDGNQEYTLPVATASAPAAALGAVTGDLHVSGNGARLVSAPGGDGVPLARVALSGKLRLDRVLLDLLAPVQAHRPLDAAIVNAGQFTLERSVVSSSGGRIEEPLLATSGEARISRTLFDFFGKFSQDPLIEVDAGRLELAATTFARNEVDALVSLKGGSSRFESVTAIENRLGTLPFTNYAAQAGNHTFGHALLQDNHDSGNLSPPIRENCDAATITLRFNIENYTRCAFTAAGDQSALDLGAFAFDSAVGGYRPIGAAVDGGAIAAEAAATGCNAVDQRGAPRPQTLVPGATPRCDIGAIELGINPYRGIWQPTRSGHGVELHTAGNQLLLVWYTYGDDGQPTSYQAAAPLTGPHWEADLLLPRRNTQTGAISAPRVGRVTIDFSSDTDAQLGWRFDSRGTTGSERIRPALFAVGEPRFEVSGVWYPPAESGYGATVTRRGEVTALVLYYYDAAGNIRWVLGSSNGADALQIPVSSFTGFCPDCDAAAMPVAFQPAGSVLVHFQTPGRARLDTAVTYPGAAGGSWNRQRAALVPLNDPVDNRAAAPTGR